MLWSNPCLILVSCSLIKLLGRKVKYWKMVFCMWCKGIMKGQKGWIQVVGDSATIFCFLSSWSSHTNTCTIKPLQIKKVHVERTHCSYYLVSTSYIIHCGRCTCNSATSVIPAFLQVAWPLLAFQNTIPCPSVAPDGCCG